MNTSASKHVATSKTNQLGMVVILLAAFNVYQDYSFGGIPAIQETDVGLLLSGAAVIANRLNDKFSRKLHIIKDKINHL